jgi:alpha-L-arabinofuranosidase
VVRMANFAQLVNAIAPIFTSREGLFLQTIYHPLRLYAEQTLDHALDVHVDGETLELPAVAEADPGGRVHHVADLGPFTLLDAVASSDAAGRAVSVAVVNRSRERGVSATLDLGSASVAGAVAAWEVNGPDVSATNTFATPHAVGVRDLKLDAKGARVEHVFPAHSVTVMRFDVSLPG